MKWKWTGITAVDFVLPGILQKNQIFDGGERDIPNGLIKVDEFMLQYRC
jgi:hypothetical protein